MARSNGAPESSNTAGFNGAGGTKKFSDKTPAEIVKDLAAIITAQGELTNGRGYIDTILLPLAQYNRLAYTSYGPEGSKTILQFIKENFPSITLIDWVSDLKGAGAGGTDRIMAFARAGDKVDYQMPQLFEQFPAQQKGMEQLIHCHAESAGTIVYFPSEFFFADGA